MVAYRESDAHSEAGGAVDHEQHVGRDWHPRPQAPQARRRDWREDRPVPDWPVSKGCTPPYVPVWVELMVKRQG
jgi:hypothetical protein